LRKQQSQNAERLFLQLEPDPTLTKFAPVKIKFENPEPDHVRRTRVIAHHLVNSSTDLPGSAPNFLK
jgi:hypothetical protein